ICLPAFEAALLLASGEWRAPHVFATLVVPTTLAVSVCGIWYGLTSRRLRTGVLGALLALVLMCSAGSVVLLWPRSMAAYSPQAGLLGLSCVLFVRPYLSAIRCARNERQILADDSGSIEHRFRSSKSRRAAVRQTPFTGKNIGRVAVLLSATALCTG